jgi:hypothetical protein
MQQKRQDYIEAYYSFDCMKEFFYRGDSRFDLPEHFFILAVSDELHIGPIRIKTE